MATLLQIRTKVRERLNEPSARFFSDVQLTNWINEGAGDIARRTETLLTSGTVSLIANQQQYAAPVDVQRIHRMEAEMTGDTRVHVLEYRDFNNMDEVWWARQKDTVGHHPYYYTLWGFPPSLTITVYPTPDTNGTLRIFYYKTPTVAVADGDTIQVPGGWEDLVVDYAEFHALRTARDGRWQEAKQLYEQKVMDMFERTRRWTDGPGLVTSHDAHHSYPDWLVGD